MPIYDGANLVVEFPIAREHGAWRFPSSANLLATYDELYPLPDVRTRVTSRVFTTVEDAADGLVNTLNVGTSWDLLDLLDSTNKAELTEMVKRMGLRDEDLIRSLDSTLRSIRARSGRARVQSITMTYPERAHITIAFANGDIDDVAAVNEDGYWLIQMPR